MLKYIFGGLGLTSIALSLQPFISALQPYWLYFFFGGLFLFLVPVFQWILSKPAGTRKVKNKEKAFPLNGKKRLERARETVLLTISNNPGSTDVEVAKFLTIGTDVARFHLEELKKVKFVKVAYKQGSDWENIPYREEWSTDQLGRKYLIHHKLIK